MGAIILCLFVLRATAVTITLPFAGGVAVVGDSEAILV